MLKLYQIPMLYTKADQQLSQLRRFLYPCISNIDSIQITWQGCVATESNNNSGLAVDWMTKITFYRNLRYCWLIVLRTYVTANFIRHVWYNIAVEWTTHSAKRNIIIPFKSHHTEVSKDTGRYPSKQIMPLQFTNRMFLFITWHSPIFTITGTTSCHILL